MNNKGEFERIVGQKLESFEYSYDAASWKKFKKQIPGKSSFYGIAAALTVAIVTVVGLFWYFNSNDKSGNCSIINTITNSVIPNSFTLENEIKTNVNNVENKTNTPISNVVSVIDNNVKNNDILVNVVEDQKENVNSTKDPDFINPVNVTKAAKPNATFICRETEGCVPFTTKFVPVEISDSTIYSWDFGDGNISTEKMPNHTYKRAGNYSVLLIVKYFKSEAVISNMRQYLVKVNDTPTALFATETDNSVVSFTNASVNANSFKWVFNDSESFEENTEKTFTKNGKYSVKLIATNKSGCSDTINKNIDIKINHPLYIPNAFTPNIAGQNSTFGPIVENSEEYYFVFEIFSKTGQLVFSAKGNNVNWDGINKNNGQQAEVGVYLYKLKSIDKYGNVDERNGIINLLK